MAALAVRFGREAGGVSVAQCVFLYEVVFKGGHSLVAWRELLPIVDRHVENTADFDCVHNGPNVVVIGDWFIAIPCKVSALRSIVE